MGCPQYLVKENRHCERSEAIQKAKKEDWIASSLALLAMTAAHI
jgi:hypothetical protein